MYLQIINVICEKIYIFMCFSNLSKLLKGYLMNIGELTPHSVYSANSLHA